MDCCSFALFVLVLSLLSLSFLFLYTNITSGIDCPREEEEDKGNPFNTKTRVKRETERKRLKDCAISG